MLPDDEQRVVTHVVFTRAVRRKKKRALLSVRQEFSSAIMCKQTKAHAFTASTGILGVAAPSPERLFLRHNAQAVGNARILVPHALGDDPRNMLGSISSVNLHSIHIHVSVAYHPKRSTKVASQSEVTSNAKKEMCQVFPFFLENCTSNVITITAF